MWDTVQSNEIHLTHDLPCPRCGHAVHTYLACSDTCACAPTVLPGSLGLAARHPRLMPVSSLPWRE
jgi:hypothetical protein